MMRLSPWDEPNACGGLKRSSPTTLKPRRDSARTAAAPMAPRPTTITSELRGMIRLDGGAARRRGLHDPRHSGIGLAERRHGLLALTLVGAPGQVARVYIHEGLHAQ